MTKKQLIEELQAELLTLGAGDIQEIDPNLPLAVLGVDSLLKTAFFDKIEGRYGLDAESMDPGDDVSITQLATAIESTRKN